MKTKNKIRIASLIVAIAALVVVNVVGVLLGKEGKDIASFVVALVCANIMIVIEEVLILLETRGNHAVFYRVLGAPLHTWALTSIGLQVAFLIALVSVNYFMPFPMTPTIIVQVILFAFFVVQLVFGYILRDLSFGLDKKIAEKTVPFEEYRKRVKIILIKDASPEFKEKMEAISEKMRYMSPVADGATEKVDASIDAKIAEIEALVGVEGAEEEKLLGAAKSLEALLAEREILSVK